MMLHIIIIFCSKRVAKYQNLMNLYIDLPVIDYVYTIGLLTFKRDKWLQRVRKAEDRKCNRRKRNKQ